jgi:hypothetical protein
MLRTYDPWPIWALGRYAYTSDADTVMREAPVPGSGPGPAPEPERKSVDDCDCESDPSRVGIEDEVEDAAAAQGNTLPSEGENLGTETLEDKIAAERRRIAHADWADLPARALAHDPKDRTPEWSEREDSPASVETAAPSRPTTPEDVIPVMQYHEYTMGGGIDRMEWIDKDEPEPMYESEPEEEESEEDARRQAAQALIEHPFNWFTAANQKENEREEDEETDELGTRAYRKWEASDRGLPAGDAEYETESTLGSGSETETESECGGRCECEREARSETDETDETDETEMASDSPLRERYITNLKTALLRLYPPSRFIQLPLVKEYIARLTLDEIQSIIQTHVLDGSHVLLITRTHTTLEASASSPMSFERAANAMIRRLFPPDRGRAITVETSPLIDAMRAMGVDKLREALPEALKHMTTEQIWAVVIAPKVTVVEPVLIELYGAAAAMGVEEGVGFGLGCEEWWEREGARLAEGF